MAESNIDIKLRFLAENLTSKEMGKITEQLNKIYQKEVTIGRIAIKNSASRQNVIKAIRAQANEEKWAADAAERANIVRIRQQDQLAAAIDRANKIQTTERNKIASEKAKEAFRLQNMANKELFKEQDAIAKAIQKLELYGDAISTVSKIGSQNAKTMFEQFDKGKLTIDELAKGFGLNNEQLVQMYPNLRKVTSETTKMNFDFLNMLFVGMQLQRTFGGALKNMYKGFSSIADESNTFLASVNNLGVSFKFLGFSIINSLQGGAIEGAIKNVSEVFENLGDFFQANPEVSELVISIASVGWIIGGALVTGSLAQQISNLFMTSVGKNVTLGTLSAGLTISATISTVQMFSSDGTSIGERAMNVAQLTALGATLGYWIGGPIGAGVGSVIGLTASLVLNVVDFTQDSEARRRFEQAQEDVQTIVNDMFKSGIKIETGALNKIVGDAIVGVDKRELTESFKTLNKQFELEIIDEQTFRSKLVSLVGGLNKELQSNEIKTVLTEEDADRIRDKGNIVSKSFVQLAEDAGKVSIATKGITFATDEYSSANIDPLIEKNNNISKSFDRVADSAKRARDEIRTNIITSTFFGFGRLSYSSAVR